MLRRFCLTIGLILPTVLTALSEYVYAQPKLPKSDRPVTEFLRETSRQFGTREESQGIGFFVAFFVFLIALAVLLIWLDYYYRRRHLLGIDDPRHLFSELIRAHGLGRTEQRFLRDFADEMDLSDPLPLFIEPKYFLATLDDDRFIESKPMIESLLKTLFGIENQAALRPDVSVSGLYRGATTIIHRPVEHDE